MVAARGYSTFYMQICYNALLTRLLIYQINFGGILGGYGGWTSYFIM